MSPPLTKLWTKTRNLRLARLWRDGGPELAAAELGRSVAAIVQQAKRLGLPDPAQLRGCVTVAELARASGYSVCKVRNAVRDLGLVLAERPQRALYERRRGRSAITPEQQRLVLERLARGDRIFANEAGDERSAQGAWGVGRKPAACLGGCGRKDRPHRARGYCGACYERLRAGGAKPPPLPSGTRSHKDRPQLHHHSLIARGPLDHALPLAAPSHEVAARLAREAPPERRAELVELFDEAQGKGREWHEGVTVFRRASAPTAPRRSA